MITFNSEGEPLVSFTVGSDRVDRKIEMRLSDWLALVKVSGSLEELRAQTLMWEDGYIPLRILIDSGQELKAAETPTPAPTTPSVRDWRRTARSSLRGKSW